MTFNFHARYGLFTYAQCDGLDPEAVGLHFTSMGAECIISREDHCDGGHHLHVFADFGRKRRIRGERTFDVLQFHPNIVPSKGSPERGYDYATKDGDIVWGGLERPGGSNVGAVRSRNAIDFAQLVEINDAGEFWDAVARDAPSLLLRSFTSIHAYAAWRFKPKHAEYSTPEGIEFDLGSLPDLCQWKESYVPGYASSGGLGVSDGIAR